MQHIVNYIGRLTDAALPFEAFAGVELINNGSEAVMLTVDRDLAAGDTVADFDMAAAGGTTAIRLFRIEASGEELVAVELDTPASGKLLWPGDEVVTSCSPDDILVQAGLVLTVSATGLAIASGSGIFMMMWPLFNAENISRMEAIEARLDALEV